MSLGDKNNDNDDKISNNSLTGQDKAKPSSKGGSEYFEQVSALNISVMNWIKSHVDDNPCIDLQPVFRDYEKHMKDIESKYGQKKQTSSESTNLFAAASSIKNNVNILKTPESSNQSPIGLANTANAPSLFSNLKSSTPIPSSSLGQGMHIMQ